MPQENNPGKLLSAGQFYSPVEATLRSEDFVISKLRQPCSRQVPRHEHELSYITVVLDGNYLEGDHGKLDPLPPFSAVFNPAGATHTTVIGPGGASFFTIELREHHLQELCIHMPRRTIFDRGAGTMLWPGLRLYSAFKAQTLDPLVMEGHVMEMLGAIAYLSSTEKLAADRAMRDLTPKWFGRVKECLHEEFRGNLRLRDLAHDAGVHPVHLARVFRKIERSTPGNYLHRLRVRAACRLLRESDCALAVVAAECGFSDQSHFTRVFKKLTRSTPAQFRREIGD
jgi:AraC family transcriptional regulator